LTKIKIWYKIDFLIYLKIFWIVIELVKLGRWKQLKNKKMKEANKLKIWKNLLIQVKINKLILKQKTSIVKTKLKKNNNKIINKIKFLYLI